MGLRIFDSVRAVPAALWDALPGARLTMSHAYLAALEESGCAVAETGWQASIFTVWGDGDGGAGAGAGAGAGERLLGVYTGDIGNRLYRTHG